MWHIDKRSGTAKHAVNGLTLTITNGEVVNIENLTSLIKLGALPGLIREALLAYKGVNKAENKKIKKHLLDRPLLTLKKRAG